MDFDLPDLSGLGAAFSKNEKAMRAPYEKLSRLAKDAEDIRKCNEAIREHSEKISSLDANVDKIQQSADAIRKDTSDISASVSKLFLQVETLGEELAEERARAEKAEKRAHRLAFAAGTISLLVSLWFPELKDLLYALGSSLAD